MPIVTPITVDPEPEPPGHAPQPTAPSVAPIDSIVEQYSGIVFNQNQKPGSSDFFDITDGAWRYQELFLPDDYARGVGTDQIIPPLSGSQILVGVDIGAQQTASLEWTFDYRIFGVGWVTLASGLTEGIHSEGDQVWMDLPFKKPVDLNLTITDSRMRIGFRNVSGVNRVWYSNPNPLALKGFAKLRSSDGATAIQVGGNDVSILFRVLSLVVDSGTDFLGNSYRSALRSNVSDNTSTVDGAVVDRLYISEPAPSRFAVKSLYYDVRAPSPKRYGTVNRIVNPSFESGAANWTSNGANSVIEVPPPANLFPNPGAETDISLVKVPFATASLARTTSQTQSGTASFQLTALSEGVTRGYMWMANSDRIPVVAGSRYSASYYSRAATIARNCSTFLSWYDANGNEISYSNNASALNATGAWTRNLFENVLSPPNAVACEVGIFIYGAVLSEVHYIDSIMLTESATSPTFFIGESWADRGVRALRLYNNLALTDGYVQSATFPVITGRTYGASAVLKVVTPLSNGMRFVINWYDLNDVFLSGSYGEFTTGTGIKYMNMTAVAPANAAKGRLVVQTTGTSAFFDFSVDSVIVTEGGGIPQYRDGDDEGWQWTGSPHNSTSVEVIEGTITDDQVVIDNVLVDPVTTGVWFSIYYSGEGDRPDTEEGWENKLWTKVPGSFQALKRESHKLPAPITTKFVKIEFTHLQARSYNPGDFAKPVSYKKHPKWVLDYFLTRIAAEKALNDQISFGRVAVVYDALDLAYNYYLDDLKQEPEEPVQSDANFSSTLAFFDRRDDKSDLIDSSVLSRINLAMAPYKDLPIAFTRENTLMGALLQAVAPDVIDYPVEQSATARADIAPLRNTEMVQESDYPVMFFYLTCRHKYREITAPFSHDRAYFVAIREVAFTRERYAVAYDTDRYIESAGDLFNIERNDFNNNNGVLIV